MKNIFILLFFFSAPAFGNEACSSYLGVKVNGFIGETLETLAKTSDCNDSLKTLKFNTVEGQLKSDYCACVSTNPKSLSGKSLATLKNDPKYKESKDKAKKAIEEKYAKALRNKIFGTLSRSFKFDNLAKRGYLSNEVARNEDSNKCNLDNILSSIGDFKSFSDQNTSCRNKDKLFEERKKLLFPEGEETFIQNLKDTANTVAKGVRANGSCLTYQNYLELNSTIPQNSEAVKILQTSRTWEDFKAKVAEEINTFERYKERLNKVRSAENNTAVANKLWGFSGIENRGKEVYRMLKSNPAYELALRDKNYFLKMQRDMNLLQNENSNGGFVSTPKEETTDLNAFFNKKSEEALKLHLNTCDSSSEGASKNARSSGRGGGSANDSLGLKQSIAKFLCDDQLPTPRVSELDESLNTDDGGVLDLIPTYKTTLKSDLICESQTKSNPSFFTDIDSSLNVDQDLDINDQNSFLADYKNFSAVICKLADPSCSDPKTANSNKDCNTLTRMADNSLHTSLYSFYKNNKLDELAGEKNIPFLKRPLLRTLQKILDDGSLSDEDAIKEIRNQILAKYSISEKDPSYKRLEETILLLRSNTATVKLYRDSAPFLDKIPANRHKVLGSYYDSKDGKAFLESIKNTPEGKILYGNLLQDTSLIVTEDISNSIFADVFTNGHNVNQSESNKKPIYASQGPEVDLEFYSKSDSNTSTSTSSTIITKTNDGNQRDQNSSKSPNNGTPSVSVSTPPDSSETSVGSSGSTKIRTLDDLIARNTSTQKRTPSSKIEPPKVDKPKEDPPVVTESSKIEEPKTTTERKTVNLENGSNLPNSTALQTISFTSSGSSIERGGGGGSSTKQLLTDDGESPADKLKKQKMLDEIARIKEQLKEGNSNFGINDESVTSNMESENDRFRARIKALEDEFDRRNKGKSNNYSNNVSNLSSSSGYDNDYDSDYSNNYENRSESFNPRDPFKRAETKREVTPEHMDELDPAGLPVANKSGKGKGGQAKGGGVGLTSGSEGGGLAALGLRPLKKRGLASESDELEPEEVCDFDQQELNCIFEHSEIFKRYDKNQIRSLVEGLLLHGYSFKTIDILNTRDPNKPHKYIVHFFEPEKNLSKEEKIKRLALIKKMLLDYKKNYNFLKAIASKVVKTRSVEISKGEAFTTLKHTLKKADIDRLLKRRLSLIERVPASKK